MAKRELIDTGRDKRMKAGSMKSRFATACDDLPYGPGLLEIGVWPNMAYANHPNSSATNQGLMEGALTDRARAQN